MIRKALIDLNLDSPENEAKERSNLLYEQQVLPALERVFKQFEKFEIEFEEPIKLELGNIEEDDLSFSIENALYRILLEKCSDQHAKVSEQTRSLPKNVSTFLNYIEAALLPWETESIESFNHEAFCKEGIEEAFHSDICFQHLFSLITHDLLACQRFLALPTQDIEKYAQLLLRILSQQPRQVGKVYASFVNTIAENHPSAVHALMPYLKDMLRLVMFGNQKEQSEAFVSTIGFLNERQLLPEFFTQDYLKDMRRLVMFGNQKEQAEAFVSTIGFLNERPLLPEVFTQELQDKGIFLQAFRNTNRPENESLTLVQQTIKTVEALINKFRSAPGDDSKAIIIKSNELAQQKQVQGIDDGFREAWQRLESELLNTFAQIGDVLKESDKFDDSKTNFTTRPKEITLQNQLPAFSLDFKYDSLPKALEVFIQNLKRWISEVDNHILFKSIQNIKIAIDDALNSIDTTHTIDSGIKAQIDIVVHRLELLIASFEDHSELSNASRKRTSISSTHQQVKEPHLEVELEEHQRVLTSEDFATSHHNEAINENNKSGSKQNSNEWNESVSKLLDSEAIISELIASIATKNLAESSIYKTFKQLLVTMQEVITSLRKYKEHSTIIEHCIASINEIRNHFSTQRLTSESILRLEKFIQEIQVEDNLSSPFTESQKNLKERLSEVVKKQPKIKERIPIWNSGLIIFHPFLRTFFTRVGLMNPLGEFKTDECRFRAAYLLHALTGSTEPPQDHLMTLNKLLCGINILLPLDYDFEITEEEQNQITGLIKAVINNWTVIRNTSVAGFQETFVRRPGMIERSQDDWILRVESHGVDILLEEIPWNIHLITLSWMDYLIHVDWKTVN